MKLSEALLLRVDLQNKLRQIEIRLIRNAKIQEGEEPSENPLDLLKEYDECNKQWEKLVKDINKTNFVTKVDDDKLLSDLIAEKDALKQKLKVLHKLCESATIYFERYSRSEIKQKSTVNVNEIQKDIDKLSKNFRELDNKLQAINWTTELIS